MNRSDILTLVTKLQGLYGDRFPALLPKMADVWLDCTRHLEEALVQAGLMRWARQHTFKPPSLDELLEQVELVRDEQKRLARRGSSTKSYLETLQDAAETQGSNPLRTPDDASYGRLMVRLAERCISPWQDDKGQWRDKWTMADCADQCYRWADYYREKRPILAQDLEAAARQYASMGETPVHQLGD